MASDSDTSLVQNHKAKAVIWDHFRLKKENGQIIPNYAVCIHCSEVIKPAGGTSNLSSHTFCHFCVVLSATKSPVFQ